MAVQGLTSEEVAERVANGEVNSVEPIVSRSYKDIIVKNVCTTFNLILFVLGAILLILDEPINALAATGTIILNITIAFLVWLSVGSTNFGSAGLTVLAVFMGIALLAAILIIGGGKKHVKPLYNREA